MYDRAPIVVTPNICALPERGGRKFTGSNSSQGLGYFHPHAKLQANTVRDSVETVSPTIFSKQRSTGPMYDHDYYDYDHVVASLLFDASLDSSDLGVFYTPPPRVPPTPPSSSSSSTSIPHSSLSPRLVYDTSTTPTSSPSLPSNNNTASHSDDLQEKKKSSVDVGRKKRGKNRVEGECQTKWSILRRPATSDSYISPEVGCLGGF